MSQLSFWNSAATVASYKRAAFLYAPEMRLLGLLKSRWSETEMLDIGIGAGRTCGYFAELTKRYVGIDYAENMVRVCESKFSGRWPHAEFAVGDATQLACRDASFDLVLFSFNGIDCMDFEGRAKVLSEMKRVCRPGGCIAFSSHNLHCIPRQMRFHFSRSPRALLGEWRRFRTMRSRNSDLTKVMTQRQVLFVDGFAGDGALAHVRPDVQRDELLALGLKNVRMFSSVDGSEITKPKDFEDESVSWVLYVCET